jgi:two-component system cell cycle response regulator CpdR
MPNENKPTVLLVDDEILILDLLQSAIEEGGYNVMLASSGAMALSMLDQHALQLAGIVTDVNLGAEESGWDVARHARKLNKDLPVVYITGASGHEWSLAGVPKSIVVGKPFAPVEVVVALATLMVKDK